MSRYPVLQRCLFGSILTENLPFINSDPVVSITGTCREGTLQEKLELDREQLGRGILVGGATGTGKTVLLRKMANQIRGKLGNNYSMIVLEAKDDYYGELSAPGDLIIGQGQYRDVSEKWSVFEDLVYDGWDDDSVRLNCSEFARQMVADKKDQTQQFFVDATQLLLYCVLVTYIQQGKKSLEERRKLSNKGLRDFFAQYRPSQYVQLMKECEEPGIIRMILGESMDNLQALGVIGETVVTILSAFVDIFGEEGNFSIRRFVHEKMGKTLFLKYDPAYKETQKKIYGFLVNLMLKEVLSQGNNSGNVIFLCDELPVLGKIDLATAVNLGRAKGLVCIAGFQSIEQIYSIYGESEGNAMLSGFSTNLFFAPNDIKTREYIKGVFGENLVETIALSPGGSVSERHDGHVVEDSHLNSMGVGDCICGLPGQDPYLFHISL